MLPTQVMSELGCNFVHRRLIAAGKGFLTGGPIGAGIGLIGGPGDSTQTALGAQTVTPSKLTGRGPCPQGSSRNRRGECVGTDIRSRIEAFVPGGETGIVPALPSFGDDFGVAVMGRFGAALEPEQLPATRLRCPRGAVLGIDDLCYNKRDLKKSERKWPPGTKPVLTGGQVNILKEAQRIQHRMQKLGLTGTVTHHRRKTRKLLR